MFQFPTFAFHHPVEWYPLQVPGCPIRISADRFVFANPRGFSQLITSFVAFQSPGIPHVPLFTFISPSGVSLRTAGYDKYTLASLICSNELFIILLFCSCSIPPCQRSPSRLPPPRHNRLKGYRQLSAAGSNRYYRPRRTANIKLFVPFFFASGSPAFRSAYPHTPILHAGPLEPPPRVENNGFEPLTLCVQGRCSSQLS